MAVSKFKPKPADLSTSLSMLNPTEPISSTAEAPRQIQTGAPDVKTLQDEKPASQSTPLTTKDTQIIFRTTETNKNSLKGFFASYGFTLSKGIQLACFYLEQEIKSGNITIGPAGIVKKER